MEALRYIQRIIRFASTSDADYPYQNFLERFSRQSHISIRMTLSTEISSQRTSYTAPRTNTRALSCATLECEHLTSLTRGK